MTASASQISINETIQKVEKWATPDIENFLREVSGVLVRRKLSGLPFRESELLLNINQPALSTEKRDRYRLLYKKLQAETIAPDEHTELLDLIQKQERHNVERLKYLVELAQIRNVSLDLLMHQLSIQTLAEHG